MVDDPTPTGVRSEVRGDRAMAQTMQEPASATTTGKKWVYLFDEGDASMRDLLGGKGAGCAEMTKAGLPVPAGFTITTEACNAFYAEGGKLPAGLWDQVRSSLQTVEGKTGKRFGDPTNPLLISVRSGAKFSMPGMMDTVLNLGLNDQVTAGLAKLTDNERFAFDAYRRFVQLFGKIVLGVKGEVFEHELEAEKNRFGAKTDADLSADALKDLVGRFKAIVREQTGKDFPTDPLKQLEQAIMAVFASWNGKRAIDYRNFNRISHDLGTAVNVQTMVFGNMGPTSGTGVAFTRNPSTGEKRLYGEYLLNAQGEDVVAGTRTPAPIATLERDMPEVYKEFTEIGERLERHYKDVQDLEFTIENGKLYMLQTRSAKRTGPAAVKIAVDLVREGVVDKRTAIGEKYIPAADITQLLLPRFIHADKEKATTEGRLLSVGLNASPGAAAGKAIFSADRASELGAAGESVVLVRPETSPDDVHGMIAARGVLTARGGATSHAAVVARSMGKPCVAGAGDLQIDERAGAMRAGDKVIREGDFISIDGTTGEVFAGQIATRDPNFAEEIDLQTVLGWADEIRRLEVWANGDYPRDAIKAREFGAQGIGLCRTEHMFFEEERLPIVQQMILAENEGDRQAALDKLLPIQKEDFRGILRAMAGLPVVIRLIDPPLHEFLPSFEDQLTKVVELRTRGNDPTALAKEEKILHAIEEMREQNPMLGLRGIRLGLTFPGIIDMQCRAIIGAACELVKEGVDVRPEIMVPLVSHVNELERTRVRLERVADEEQARQGIKVHFKIGTMIELPRACITAGDIAKHAEFFSFGTNDLTQTTFGFSRDDAEGKFLLRFVQEGILPENPFQVLDRDGVGELVRIAVQRGRATRPDLEVGICGEHGGDPSSIAFCHQVGLNYVSCSPFRVPVARLAAAQAALQGGDRDK
jgi:pyruvate,orthophosphate dikinase